MRVADWFVRKGYTVRIPAMRIAPSHDEWEDFADDGDLMVERRIEVKHRDVDFTDAGTFPFPDVIVCAKHAWDRADPKPYAIVSLNRAMTHAAIIKGASAAYWRVQTLEDKRYCEKQDFLICPMRYVTFVTLTP